MQSFTKSLSGIAKNTKLVRGTERPTERAGLEYGVIAEAKSIKVRI